MTAPFKWVATALIVGSFVTAFGWFGGGADPNSFPRTTFPGMLAVWLIAEVVMPQASGASPILDWFFWVVFWVVNSAVWGGAILIVPYALWRRRHRTPG